MGSVRRVDRDQNGSDLGGSELGYHPFQVVGNPNPHVLAFIDAHSHESSGHTVAFCFELSVGEPRSSLHVHQGLPISVPLCLGVQQVTDGIL